MKENTKIIQITTLAWRALQNQLKPHEFEILEDLLANDPEARAIYLEFMANHATMNQSGFIFESSPVCDALEIDDPFRQVVEKDLSESAVRKAMRESQDTLPEPPGDSKAGLPRRSEPSFQKLIKLVARTAAIVLLCLTVLWLDRTLMQCQPAPIHSVGLMADAMNVQWKPGGVEYRIGEKIYPGELELETGCAKFAFHDGAEVVIEGPARFSLVASDRLDLQRGRAYARIGPDAIGFSIVTPNSKVIDLGTEFGVIVDSSGSSQVHMIKGRASLLAGKRGQERSSSLIEAGQAGRVDPASGKVHSITMEKEAFVRDISSSSGLAWRGQMAIDLADVIGGGNGFGAGNPDMVIDPATGKFTEYVERGKSTRSANSTYNPVAPLKYVDGVFVPNSNGGPLVVSSLGTQMTPGPRTSGCFRKDITVLNKVYRSEGGNLTDHDIKYGYPFHPAISMHANLGITFDLEAIRKDLPANVDIAGFEALCAVAVSPNETDLNDRGMSDFWILIDGKEQKSYQAVKPGFSQWTQLAITPGNRFLTILTTDHRQNADQDPIQLDRCFFGDPVLRLTYNDK